MADQLRGGPAHGPLEPSHHVSDLCVLLHGIERLLNLGVSVHQEVVQRGPIPNDLSNAVCDHWNGGIGIELYVWVSQILLVKGIH